MKIRKRKELPLWLQETVAAIGMIVFFAAVLALVAMYSAR